MKSLQYLLILTCIIALLPACTKCTECVVGPNQTDSICTNDLDDEEQFINSAMARCEIAQRSNPDLSCTCN